MAGRRRNGCGGARKKEGAVMALPDRIQMGFSDWIAAVTDAVVTRR